MRIIRWILGKIILFLDAVFSPKIRELSLEDRKKVSNASANMALYQFESCPFCVKVRRFMKSEGIEVPLVDATIEPGRGELLRGGGKLQAPCLKITETSGAVRWLYESNDIIHYLRSNVAAKPASA